jgi:hypothetical protein
VSVGDLRTDNAARDTTFARLKQLATDWAIADILAHIIVADSLPNDQLSHIYS